MASTAPTSAAPGPAANPAPGFSGFEPGPEPTTGFLPDHFVEAFVHARHRVCGRVLPPYSLHTHLMLSAVGSPFACEELPAGFQITWEDVWTALAAITTPYGRALRMPSGLWCAIKQRLFRYDLEREVLALLAWRRDHHSAPEIFCESEETPRPLGSPAIMAKAAFLYRHASGLTREEIWTMSLGELLWTHAAILEQVNDNVSLLSQNVADFFALMKKLQDGEVELPPRPDDQAFGDRIGRVAAAAGIPRT